MKVDMFPAAIAVRLKRVSRIDSPSLPRIGKSIRGSGTARAYSEPTDPHPRMIPRPRFGRDTTEEPPSDG